MAKEEEGAPRWPAVLALLAVGGLRLALPNRLAVGPNWLLLVLVPVLMDYLFLAFNTSTAFSPTDAPVLSRWAKGMMMLQSLMSLATVTLLAARAVNIL